MQLVNVFLVNIAHSYMIKSFLGLRNGNAFTEAETGEPPISRQNALECTESHIKFQNFSAGNTPGPPSTEGSAPDAREGRERKRRWGEAGKEGVGKGDKFWSPHFSDQSYAPDRTSPLGDDFGPDLPLLFKLYKISLVAFLENRQNCCHQMSDFRAKMHQIRFRLGLCPRRCWKSLQRSPRPPSWI